MRSPALKRTQRAAPPAAAAPHPAPLPRGRQGPAAPRAALRAVPASAPEGRPQVSADPRWLL